MRRSVEAAAVVAVCVVLLCGAAPHLVTYHVHGDSIDAALTGEQGDACSQQIVFIDSQRVPDVSFRPFPDPHLQGSVVPC